MPLSTGNFVRGREGIGGGTALFFVAVTISYWSSNAVVTSP
jgi:hypothetical protein